MFNANHNNFIKDKLKEISKKNQFRDIITTERKRYNQVFRGNKKYISFSCNDYLSLSLNRKVINASVKASKKYGAGAGASRLITGSNPLYNKLEVLLTKFKKVEACCIFGSGYLANLGVISALSSKDDLILIDELSHSSTYLGTKLTNSKIVKYQHNDMDDLEDKLEKYRKKYKKCSIITEGIFSMDGDISPQDKISKLSKKYNAFFILDDAHGLGVVGDGTGSNTIFKKENIKIDVYIGTLSKSIGSYGGFVCGSKHLINFLINRCRTQIYTTGLPPSVLAASIEAIKIIKLKKNLFKKPLKNARYFCDLIGFDDPESPIVPIIFKDEKKTLAIANYLMKKGFLVGAIRPPTVPANSSRLRLAFNASHTKNQIKELAKNIKIFI
mgnify:CR=1 FL=1